MRKIFSVLVLLAAVSGFLMAQSATKENCTIEYDSAKKVVRLTNKNADPYTIQYSIDGKGKSVVVDKQAVWELDASKAAPKAVDIVKASKAAKAGAVDKDWKVVPAAAAAPAAAAPAAGTAAPAAAAPAAGTTPAPAAAAPAAGGKAPAPAPAAGGKAPAKK